MKIKKVLLLPLLFTLTSCDFSFDFIKNIFSKDGQNNSQTESFADPKVEKAISISKEKKEVLKKETKNIFSASYGAKIKEGSKLTLDHLPLLKNTNLFQIEVFASFEDQHLEAREVREIEGVNYCLPMYIDKVNDKYEFSGPLGLFVEFTNEQAKTQQPELYVDLQKYCESVFKTCNQNLYFSDSLVEYIDQSIEESNELMESLPTAMKDYMEEATKTVQKGLKENLKCIKDDSNGNFTLETTNSFNMTTFNQEMNGVVINSKTDIAAYRLVFSNYRIESCGIIYDCDTTTTVLGETYSEKSLYGAYVEYKYNVNPVECFTDSVQILTEQQVQDYIDSVKNK